ncbi:MAG: hypothetical protein DRJ10_00825 [Bacteroidetes bacterium]|nr:MAG: hypothetical protein DRJ07_18580 [Bacteroidota bacterium]RLD84571.1 MAG: hypothetical protein DRJ10_00825 [Bacteroidota bacterium]
MMISTGIFTINMPAQETFEKEVNLKSNQAVSLELKFAEGIKIKTWNKQRLYVKAVVEHNFKEKLEFQLIEHNKNSEVEIEEKIKNLEKRKNINIGSNDDDNCINLKINYEVYLPANAKLSINSISGDIEVKSMTNSLTLETISGFVDVTMDAKGKYNIVCSTITGEIYTDLNLDKNAQPKHDIVGSKLSTSINGGGKSIKLKSISGDLFIRKRK